VVYKLGQIHFVPNHLSQIGHSEPTTRIENQLLNVALFIVQINWYAPIIEYL
jgi:hypothetical protein